MFRSKPRRPDVFVSAKAPLPIPARHPAVREALVQASFDPQVRSIAHLPSAHVSSAPLEAVDIDAVVLARDDGRFHLDVVPARQVRDIDDEGLVLIALRELDLAPLVVTAEDLKREPRRSNCGIVWSYHGRFVPVGLRIRILQTLRDDGPMELVRLLENLRSDGDPTPSVLSLACDDLLELDLISQPLGPATIARARS
ncbi:hypothetical protein [Bradyrhizobium diazoefficiens]|uniref:hypothetical protein n=1 Tax=Bradyrhizobium diazoefficiens TaxID=1355477 RepID=UPI00272DC1F9|nr:hypothetical protein [Bradyrhizobium diazoefficiens]WLA64917.1 hypothetical protein QNN01_42995 [Bradyrhizobium diazoefficiens]